MSQHRLSRLERMMLHLVCVISANEPRVHWHAFLQELTDPAEEESIRATATENEL